MDYEKKYKEALKRAKDMLSYKEVRCEDMEYLFPELKESEDERIRKALIENFKWYCGDFLETTKWGKDDNLLVKDIIAWLEKQGEQKLADKVEPKFKVGDNIIKKHNSDINKFGQFTITDITGGKYWYNDRIICDLSEQYEWELVEHKPISFDTSTPVSYDDIPFGEKDSELQEVTYYIPEGFHAEIEGDKVTIKKGEQKPDWSEEDERMLHTIIADFKGFIRDNTSTLESHFNECIDWLKSLKGRIKQ